MLLRDVDEHHALAKTVATEAITLLKNDALLPIEPGTIKKLAVVGYFAKHPRFQVVAVRKLHLQKSTHSWLPCRTYMAKMWRCTMLKVFAPTGALLHICLMTH